MGFLVAYGTSLPSVTLGDCTSNPGLLGINCISAVWSFLGLLFNLLTLGGVDSPLPALYVQGPLVLFFAITWGMIILKKIMKAAEILAEAVP